MDTTTLFNWTGGYGKQILVWSENESWNDLSSKVCREILPDIHKSFKVIICTSLLIFLTRKLITANFHLREFAGPWWAAYTRIWLCGTLASGNSAQIFVDVNDRYGPIARIGPNNLITNDPEITRHILAVNSKWHRGPWFDSIRIDPRISNIGKCILSFITLY
jgi:hypothetical protein